MKIKNFSTFFIGAAIATFMVAITLYMGIDFLSAQTGRNVDLEIYDRIRHQATIDAYWASFPLQLRLSTELAPFFVVGTAFLVAITYMRDKLILTRPIKVKSNQIAEILTGSYFISNMMLWMHIGIAPITYGKIYLSHHEEINEIRYGVLGSTHGFRDFSTDMVIDCAVIGLTSLIALIISKLVIRKALPQDGKIIEPVLAHPLGSNQPDPLLDSGANSRQKQGEENITTQEKTKKQEKKRSGFKLFLVILRNITLGVFGLIILAILSFSFIKTKTDIEKGFYGDLGWDAFVNGEVTYPVAISTTNVFSNGSTAKIRVGVIDTANGNVVTDIHQKQFEVNRVFSLNPLNTLLNEYYIKLTRDGFRVELCTHLPVRDTYGSVTNDDGSPMSKEKCTAMKQLGQPNYTLRNLSRMWWFLDYKEVDLKEEPAKYQDWYWFKDI